MAQCFLQKCRVQPVLVAIFLIFVTAMPANAAQALVAVATNFSEAAAELELQFESSSSHEVTITNGSTGKLYAQIVNGAPYDLLLAADHERPRLLAESGAAIAGTRQVYAVGRLVLWSMDPDKLMPDGYLALQRAEFRSLAIANPLLAPYGVAAKETLQALDLWGALKGRIVMGENIGQAHAMVATGNAELGIVAQSYVMSPRNEHGGSVWIIPAELHAPVLQEAVLLAHGADNVAAKAFLEYLRSADAKSTIESFGYDSE